MKFDEGIDELKAMVGDGELVGHVTFGDTDEEGEHGYASPIHEGHWLNYMGHEGFKELHVHSGEDHFLSRPLLEHAQDYGERLANNVLSPDGLHREMDAISRDLATEAAARCPKVTGHLASTAESWVSE